MCMESVFRIRIVPFHNVVPSFFTVTQTTLTELQSTAKQFETFRIFIVNTVLSSKPSLTPNTKLTKYITPLKVKQNDSN